MITSTEGQEQEVVGFQNFKKSSLKIISFLRSTLYVHIQSLQYVGSAGKKKSETHIERKTET